MSLNATALKQAGAQFPKAAGVSRFVTLLLQGIPGTPGPSTPQNIVTVQQINIGSRFRIRALSNGAVFELLGVDGNWHAQQTFQ